MISGLCPDCLPNARSLLPQDMLQKLISRHLTDKSKGRVDNVFGYYGSGWDGGGEGEGEMEDMS